MATMTMLERLKIAETAGMKAGRYGPADAPCPYNGPERHSEHEVWVEAREVGRQQRVQDENVKRRQLAAEALRVRLDEKLLQLFGDQELADEFVDYVKELIREETAPRSDY